MNNVRTYRAISTHTGWAKIFSVKTTDFNVNHNQNAMMYFSLYCGQEERAVCKDFYIYASVSTNNENRILLKDLSPETLGIECVYTVNDREVTVYVKTKTYGTYVHLKVNHANVPSFFTFYNMETFTTQLAPENINLPRHDLLVNTNEKRSLETLLVSPGSQVGYFKIGELYSAFATKNVVATFHFAEFGGDNENYASGFVTMRVRKNQSGNSYKMAISFLENNEKQPKISFHLVENQDKVDIYIYIDIAYRSMLITPILYDFSAENSVLKFLETPVYANSITPAASASYQTEIEVQQLTLLNGWVTRGTGFANEAVKVGKQVTITGNIKDDGSAQVSSGTNIATSPFNPPKKTISVPALIKVQKDDGTDEMKTCMVSIYSSGNIQIGTGVEGAKLVTFQLTYFIE